MNPVGTSLAFVAVTACLVLLEARTAEAQLSYADAAGLANKYGCSACHALDQPLRGAPSWLEISRHYRSDPNAIEELSIQVHNGSSGVFGPVPMPPVDVPPGDLEALLKWVMQLPLEPT
jgi:cytochrome c